MRKSIANRKMFRQGGAVTSGPAGIMASSPSLIDAVVQDAVNPQGGQTLSMAEGGIVKMKKGGSPEDAWAKLPPIQGLEGSARQGPMYLGDFILPAKQSLSQERVPISNLQDFKGMTRRRYTPIEAEELLSESLIEKGERVFPSRLEAGGEGVDVYAKGVPVSGLERAATKVGDVLASVGTDAAQYIKSFGQVAYDNLLAKEIAGEPSPNKPSLAQYKAISDMREVFGYDPEFGDYVEEVATRVIKDNPDISIPELKGQVANIMEEEIGDTRSTKDIEGDVLTAASDTDVETGEVPITEGLTPEDEIPIDATLSTDDTKEPQAKKTPQAGEKFNEGVDTVMGPGDEFEDPNAMKQRDEVGDEVESPGTPTDAADAAKQVAQTFDKTDMKPEEAKRGMEYYLDRFKKAMPKYEGMSDSEKGMIIAEAGLKVMAGQSPDAITNIAEGLKGVSKEFMADEKARRAYNRQVDLSAAKYGFAQLDRDRAEMLALAKEGRQMPYKLIANKDFTFEGKKVKRGQAFPLTKDQISAGLLQDLPLTYESAFLSDTKAALDLAKKTAQGREKPGSFSKDRETYLANARSLKNGARMKGLLMEAASIAIPENAADDSKVLGAVPLLKSWTDKALNAAGYQANTGVLANLRSTEPEKYRTLMKTIGTTMVTEILNESNKTISEGDRARVDDLVAAYAEYDGTVASYRSLVVKLKNLEASIDSGIEEAGRSMKGIESQWNNTIFKGGTKARDVLSDVRNFGTPLPTYSVGKRTSTPVYYKDIIDMSTRKFTPKYQKIFKVS